jgi:electron transport complex protein RnfG
MSGERLPVVGSETTSSVRLVGTLAVAGALAGLAIVLVFQWANPRIEAWRAEVLAAAVTEVLAGADRYETLFLDSNGFTPNPTADTTGLDRVYVGYDRDDTPVGVALVGAGAGFQDVIRVMFGYNPATGNVIGMQVLESKETPGLGDKIEKDSSFLAEFAEVGVPLLGLKSGRETGADSEVVMITGATISSRAIIEIINARLAEVQGDVDGFWTSAPLARGGAR